MVFNQQVQSINAAGNAIEKITIKELKYYAEVKDNKTLDFDSTKDKDPNNALFALVGKSYTIEITPSGKVSELLMSMRCVPPLKIFLPTKKRLEDYFQIKPSEKSFYSLA